MNSGLKQNVIGIGLDSISIHSAELTRAQPISQLDWSLMNLAAERITLRRTGNCTPKFNLSASVYTVRLFVCRLTFYHTFLSRGQSAKDGKFVVSLTLWLSAFLIDYFQMNCGFGNRPIASRWQRSGLYRYQLKLGRVLLEEYRIGNSKKYNTIYCFCAKREWSGVHF